MTDIIIVEGPDGAGKSTLVSQLSSAGCTRPPLHSGGPPKSSEELYDRVAHIEAFVRRGYEDGQNHVYPTILDRFPLISELVYGPLLRGQAFVGEHALNQFVVNYSPIIVYCKTARLLVDQNHKDHKPVEHTAQVLEHLKAIERRYDQLMLQMVLKYRASVVWYDYTSPGAIKDLSTALGIPVFVESAPCAD